jgi:hypothetical protein
MAATTGVDMITTVITTITTVITTTITAVDAAIRKPRKSGRFWRA